MLNTSNNSFALNNILCAPHITRNLLLVSQFCKSIDTSSEFFTSYLVVKDLRMGAMFISGWSNGNLYKCPSSDQASFFPHIQTHHVPTRNTTLHPAISFWHQGLGHPNKKDAKFHLPISQKTALSLCNCCFCNKSHKLSFGMSSLHSLQPLELLYTNVWSPALITSFVHFKYYAIFVDHFTKYTWLYPFRQKYDTTSVFEQFKHSC